MPADTRQMTCAVYTRKSSEEGLEQAFNSLDAQREACEAYISSQRHEGWRLFPKQYDDGGFSGGNMDRPALARLMNDIKEGKVSVVVVYKVDRLTRSLADFAKLVELFDRYGVSFVSVTQQFNTTTSMGRLTLNVLLSFAQFEREVTGERIRDKIAASKKKGMFMGGGYPLGYDLKDHELVVNEAEAEQVRTIFLLYLELKCVRRLQAEVAKRGFRTKVRISSVARKSGGAALSRGHLYYMLKNRTYLGEIAHKGQIYEGRHKPIIERSVWDAVQVLLQGNAVNRRGRQWAKSPSPLAGILFDDRGNILSPSHTQKGSVRYRYYVCRALLLSQLDRIGAVKRVSADELEGLIARRLRDFCADAAQLSRALEEAEVPAEYRRSAIERVRELGVSLGRDDEAGWLSLGRQVVRKIIVGQAQVLMQIDLRALVGPAWGTAGGPAHSLICDVVIPSRITRSGRQKTMIDFDADGAHRLVNDNMILALARAMKWDEEIRAGASLNALARRDGVSTTYATRIMPLAFLAPDIVEAIYEGRQPLDLKVKALSANLPLDWTAQRSRFGFPAR